VTGSVEAVGLGVSVDGTTLFHGLDLSVSAGECLMLTGPNGIGKSTLLRILYGSQKPSEGSIRVCGDIPDERSSAFRRRVSVLMEDSALFDELSPRQHLDLVRSSFPSQGNQRETTDLLGESGLGERVDVPAGHLSAGQRRRLLLLAAVARPYEVLLLDEPERAIDAQGRSWLAGLVRASKDAGAAVVGASHHPALVDELADYLVELS
jgi:ABC-type multidrug transport system ATPase subunit